MTFASHKSYRPDIDGLRAVAVVSVVLYHTGWDLFGGGFVGVDVFFVISGYLITRIILAEVGQGRFSLLRFYDRRARRILPALFFLIAGVTGAALIILSPQELQRYGVGVVWTLLFSANFHFMFTIDYFQPASHYLVLLHMWSLAVEEQFYLFWPLVILVLHRFAGRLLLPATVLAIVLSLAGAALFLPSKPDWVFYMLPFRAWELLLGAVLAIAPLAPPRSRLAAELLSGTGLLLIVAPVLLYSAATPFPGLAALPPCLGAALLIHAGRPEGLTTRLLACRPAVGIGLISYSLYLWHWPVFSLGTRVLNAVPSALDYVVMILLSVLLAWLSWAYIERPFREMRPRNRAAEVKVLGFAGATLAVLLIAGELIVRTGGLPFRFDREVVAYEMAASERNPLRGPCHASFDDLPVEQDCLLNASLPAAEPTLLLWGDSHGDHFAPGMARALHQIGIQGLQMTKSGCPPLLGYSRPESVAKLPDDCESFNRRVLDYIAQEPGIDTVVLAGSWWFHTHGKPLDEPISNEDRKESARALRTSLHRTVEALMGLGKRVVILDQVPDFPFNAGRCAVQARLPALVERRCDVDLEFVRNRAGETWTTLRSLEERYDISLLSPHRLTCQGTCRAVVDGRLLYVDDNHLNRQGGEYFTRALLPLIRGG